MEFPSGYHPVADMYSPMDRGFYSVDNSDAAGSIQGIPPEVQTADTIPHASNDVYSPQAEGGALGPTLGIQDIGMSVPMGISAPNVQGIYSKIRAGLGKIEIGFPGAFSGNRQAHTPGMYGKDQRTAIRELGDVNNVQFTTHAAYQVMGMTGAVQQGSDLIKFDMNQARMGQQEVERAIDFAADVSNGGSVVVHTGEFDRPLTDIYLDPLTRTNLSIANDGRVMFKRRLTEDKDAKYYLVDDRTGQAMSQVEKDRRVAFPEWNKYTSDNPEYWDENKGKPYKDDKGNLVVAGDYIDFQGNKVMDPFDAINGRVPKYDWETGRFKIKYMNYDDFAAEADEKNKYFKKRHGRDPGFYEAITQTEAYLQATLETNEGHSRGWALQYGERVDKHIEHIKRFKEALSYYQKLDDAMPEDEKWQMMKQQNFQGALGEIVPSESKSPVDILKEQIKSEEKNLEFARQSSASQEQQAEDTYETKHHVVEPIKYVQRYAIRHYAEAALHAMDRSVDPNNPITITMENIFPERFGGHPAELRWLIDQARETFVKYLTEPKMELGSQYEGEPNLGLDDTGKFGPLPTKNPYFKPHISKEQAAKLAENHIKATLDTGHLNLWRKYFQPAQGSTPDQNEAEFRQWYLGEVEELAKGGYIGNMHLADNFGYNDDHLSPGQGNAPIREVAEIIKKHGYDKAWTVEPGADASTDLSDFHGVMKTWRYFGSPVYGMSAPGGGQQKWGEIQNSYFGQNQPPYFVFGGYSPSNDWTLWSQTPME